MILANSSVTGASGAGRERFRSPGWELDSCMLSGVANKILIKNESKECKQIVLRGKKKT